MTNRIATRSLTKNTIVIKSLIPFAFGHSIELKECARIDYHGRIISIDRIIYHILPNGKSVKSIVCNHSEFYGEYTRKIIMTQLSTIDRLTIKNLTI